MTTFPKINRFHKNWTWWRFLITCLTIIALILSTILSWHSVSGGSMAGCDGGSSCEQVLNSRWSIIGGKLPVSGLAVGAYLSILIAGFYIGASAELPLRKLAWSIMLILSGAIFGSALWFTVVQKWFIGSFCTYCIITHTTGFFLSILIIWQSIQQWTGQPSEIKHSISKNCQSGPPLNTLRIIQPIHALGLASIGLVLAGLLALAQFSFTSSDSHHSDKLQSSNLGVEYNNTPIIGSPDAPYKVSLLFDYQCAHCQKIHFMLHEATRIYDNKLAFVLCPTPLEKSCNSFVTKNADAFTNSCEIVKISLAVWLAGKEAFYDFENWMFTYESGNGWQPRSIQDIRAKAVELVGKARFETAFSDPWIENYIQDNIRLFGQTIQNGKGGIPKLIFGSSFIIPEPYNVKDLILILQNNLGLPKP